MNSAVFVQLKNLFTQQRVLWSIKHITVLLLMWLTSSSFLVPWMTSLYMFFFLLNDHIDDFNIGAMIKHVSYICHQIVFGSFFFNLVIIHEFVQMLSSGLISQRVEFFFFEKFRFYFLCSKLIWKLFEMNNIWDFNIITKDNFCSWSLSPCGDWSL